MNACIQQTILLFCICHVLQDAQLHAFTTFTSRYIAALGMVSGFDRVILASAGYALNGWGAYLVCPEAALSTNQKVRPGLGVSDPPREPRMSRTHAFGRTREQGSPSSGSSRIL